MSASASSVKLTLSKHHLRLISPFASVMPATTAETLSLVSRTVSVAPLVLLSAADHFGRSGKGRKRVVGVLLGQNDGKNVRVSNSFAGNSPYFQRYTCQACADVRSIRSTLRRRRKGSLSMVPGPQLRGGHERHVQESKRAGKADRVVPLRTQTTSVGS